MCCSSGGQTTSTTNSAPWTVQQPYLKNVFQDASNTLGQFQGNPSSSVAGFSAPQQQAFGQTENAASGNPGGQIAGLNSTGGNFVSGLLNGNGLNANPGNSTYGAFANGSMMNNPFEGQQMSAAMDPIMRAYQTAVAPQTTSEFAGAGRYGSGAMTNAESQNQQDLVTQLGNVAAPIASGMYNTNLNNMLTGAAGLSSNYNTATGQQVQGLFGLPGVTGSDWNAISNLESTGGQQQQLAQQKLNAPWNILGNYSNLVNGQYGGSSTSTQPYSTNPLAGAMGGAAAGSAFGPWGAAAGGVLGLMGSSDRRLKTDITLVGKLESGLNVYRYRYKAGGPVQIGVMADEVRKVKPHAVIRGADGFDMVNYGAL